MPRATSAPPVSGKEGVSSRGWPRPFRPPAAAGRSLLDSDAIGQRARAFFTRPGGGGDQPLAIDIGQFQPRPYGFGGLRRKQCGQSADGIGGDPGRLLALGQHRQPLGSCRIDLGEHRAQDTALDHQRDDRHRARRDQQFEQFGRDPLARQGHQVVGAGGAGEARFVDRLAEAGMEAEEAQDAQVILGNTLQRIADEADASGLQVVQPPK